MNRIISPTTTDKILISRYKLLQGKLYIMHQVCGTVW